MQFSKIIAAETIAPDWVVCDRELDITDVWLEETDPENERGESATAFLKANKYDDGMEVAGIAIEEPEGDKTYREREAASRLIGWDAIYRIEQYEMQAPGYGADDERDIRAEWV